MHAEITRAVVGHEHGPCAGKALEQVGSRFFFVRPGIGKDYCKVVWRQPQFFVRAITLWGKPGEAILASSTSFAASRNKAALNELDGQAEIVRELLGSVHQFGFNLDAVGVKFKH